MLGAPPEAVLLSQDTETVYPVSDDVPLSTHWSLAPCVNIRIIDVVVGLTEPGTLAQEIITSAPVANLHSISLTFDCEVGDDFESQVDFVAWEALESYLCDVADEKSKKDPPEVFAVTLLFVEKDGREVQIGMFLGELQKRGVLETGVW